MRLQTGAISDTECGNQSSSILLELVLIVLYFISPKYRLIRNRRNLIKKFITLQNKYPNKYLGIASSTPRTTIISLGRWK